MTWGSLWTARSSDTSSRAAQETNLPRAKNKWSSVGLGCAGAAGDHQITPEIHSEKIGRVG